MTASALELAGLLAGCGAAAVAIVAGDPRAAHAALAVALIVAPALVVGDVWDEDRVVRFRDDPAVVAAALVAVALAIAGLCRRHAAPSRGLPDPRASRCCRSGSRSRSAARPPTS